MAENRWRSADSIAAAVLIVAAVSAWGLLKPARPLSLPAATVVIDVSPWASLSIVRKSDGQAVGDKEIITPSVMTLPAGVYRVRASNPDYPERFEFEVDLSNGPIQQVHRAMPQFEAEKEIGRIFEK